MWTLFEVCGNPLNRGGSSNSFLTLKCVSNQATKTNVTSTNMVHISSLWIQILYARSRSQTFSEAYDTSFLEQTYTNFEYEYPSEKFECYQIYLTVFYTLFRNNFQ